MKVRKHTQPVECKEYFGDDGGQIGAIITYRHFGRTRHVVELHDWCRDGDGYFPCFVGCYDEVGEAEKLIEKTAREAQAPDTVKDPLLNLLADVSDDKAFHFVPIDGGRSWEWEHKGLTYQAVSLNGSPNIQVYTNPVDDPGEWKFEFGRPTDGRSAQTVAQEVCDQVTRQ